MGDSVEKYVPIPKKATVTGSHCSRVISKNSDGTPLTTVTTVWRNADGTERTQIDRITQKNGVPFNEITANGVAFPDYIPNAKPENEALRLIGEENTGVINLGTETGANTVILDSLQQGDATAPLRLLGGKEIDTAVVPSNCDATTAKETGQVTFRKRGAADGGVVFEGFERYQIGNQVYTVQNGALRPAPKATPPADQGDTPKNPTQETRRS